MRGAAIAVGVLATALAAAGTAMIAGAIGASGASAEGRVPDLARGASLYAQNCASCHGAELEGEPDWRSPGPDGVFPAPPHDETGHTWHHGDGLLFEITKLGGAGVLKARGITETPSGMPAFEDVLTDDEIRDVLAFIRSTWPERIQEMQAVRTQAEQMQEG